MATLGLKSGRGRLTLGSSADNDHVVEHPLVSPRHAQLLRRGGATFVEDLGTRVGTWINGQRLEASRAVGPGDQIQIGPSTLAVTSAGDVVVEDLRLSARIDVQGLGYDLRRGGQVRPLLRDISFTILPGELVALMGPAGAGKTTLIENMNGAMTPTAGRVLVNGVDVHRNVDALRGHIGYVPQEDLVHRKLTVYEACWYSAKMRLRDTSDTEIDRRISETLAKLDILHIADRTIGGPEARVLSGGQRKRLNLAMELVTDPAILFLDEPTSGLSSSDASGVMRALRDLGDAGRTIIVTIHQPSREVYEMMDDVVLLGVGGRLTYFGPVREAYKCFHSAPNPDDLFEKMAPTNAGEAHWEGLEKHFRETKWHREHVIERGCSAANQITTPRPRATRAPGLSQFLLLLERLSKLYSRDLGWLVGAAIGAPLLMAFLTGQLGGTEDRRTLLFVAVLLAYFFGIFPAIEMIQSEMTLYRRERMVNLKIPSYVLSKVLFLTIFGGLQSASIATILIWQEGVDVALHEAIFVLVSVQLCGATTGLLISTVSRTNKVAMMLMLACVILMIAFSGFVVSLPGLRDDGTAWLLSVSPMRWGLGALMDVVRDVPLSQVKHLGFEREIWWLNVIVNAALAAVAVGATMLVLRARDRD